MDLVSMAVIVTSFVLSTVNTTRATFSSYPVLGVTGGDNLRHKYEPVSIQIQFRINYIVMQLWYGDMIKLNKKLNYIQFTIISSNFIYKHLNITDQQLYLNVLGVYFISKMYFFIYVVFCKFKNTDFDFFIPNFK